MLLLAINYIFPIMRVDFVNCEMTAPCRQTAAFPHRSFRPQGESRIVSSRSDMWGTTIFLLSYKLFGPELDVKSSPFVLVQIL